MKGSQRKISVFGSTGFIGSHFVEKSKFETIEIPKESNESASEEILFLIGTNSNYNVFQDVFMDVESNVIKLLATLEVSRQKFPRLVFNFVSTWFVYGPIPIPYREDQACEPKGFYSITKYAAELLLESYCKTFNLNYRIIRLGNVIGPGDKKASPQKNAIQYLADRVLSGHDVDLYEGGNFLRDLLHVDDVVKGLDLIIEKGDRNQVFNLASGFGTKIGDLLSSLKSASKSKSHFQSVDTPRFHKIVQSQDAILDISKIEKLGFRVENKISEKDFLNPWKR